VLAAVTGMCMKDASTGANQCQVLGDANAVVDAISQVRPVWVSPFIDQVGPVWVSPAWVGPVCVSPA